MLILAPRSAALLVAAGSAASLAAALYFQHALGYVPCALCLLQRWPHYLAIPLAVALGIWGGRIPRALLIAGLVLVAVLFVANAGLGAYHAGIEWKFWPGPTSCSAGAAGPSSGNFIDDLKATRVVACDAAPWRFLGLSFAGWNTVISAGLAAIALLGLSGRNSQGSSSVSQ